MSALDVRAIDAKELRRAARPAVRHDLEVFLSEEAFDRAVERGAADTTREIGGVLVGEVLHDDCGPYLRIETTIDALHADEKGAELTFTHATWEHIHKEMDTRHKGKRVVGWYHTHPGFGVFLSDRDQFIHKSFFDLPFQVAFVYDPKSREHGMFAWRDNEVWRMRRYAIGGRAHAWDGDRAAPRVVAETPPTDAGETRERTAAADDASGGSLFSFAVFGILLVLVAGFLGHCWGAQAGAGAARQAQLQVIEAQNQGAQLAIASLQDDLIGIVRDTLGDQAVRAPVDRAIAELDALAASVHPRSAADVTAFRTLARIHAAREALVQLRATRGSAEATLAAIQRATRQGAETRTNLAREVAEQRAGIAALYAELAADAARSGDLARARRLLATAAHLDPSNRTRYATQLQSLGANP
jgi:proteasome lid subunit RPN8/RPN11